MEDQEEYYRQEHALIWKEECEHTFYCECDNPNYDAWEDQRNERVFDDEKGFCAICHQCGMWHN